MVGAAARDASALLLGPRGRRLCLELATMLDAGTRQAVPSAAHALDPGAGTSRLLLSSASEGGPPQTSVDDVVSTLAAARWPVPGPRELLAALDRAVGSARYWQEPDGEDVLAAVPAVRAALTPVAQLIADSAHTACWAQPFLPSAQWSVVWHEEGRPDLDRAGRTADLDTWYAEALAEEARARRERPADPAANLSGMWWSAPPSVLPRTTRDLGATGPVGLGLVEDSSGWRNATVRRVAVPPGTRVTEIDGAEAWVDLCRRFPLDVTASRRHDWYRTTGRSEGSWVQPNWAAVAREADALHLSAAAYLSTAGSALPVGQGATTVLAGWDPDATVWLNGLPQSDDEGSNVQHWVFDRDQDSWRPTG